ncbi:hypothetical protein [Achromobacter xylosoxidans]|uniref:hypothetical protein n=1 Tax=Alcaligenes xylosoxydans xylosoxydans TaxID=85698 RepID=UPI0012DE68B5|nr:hypothetical protein [Achromobacter xylosoxidans]MCZ8441466.1 hypothetical protein [Achromobacter xylosoxidans]MDC6165104.1 hypothetical protein [Achromobacter xylosoxidans]
MAGVPDSTPPAPPPGGAKSSAIRVRHDGHRTLVEVGGVPLSRLTSVDVSFGGWGQLPEVRVSMAPLECDMQIEGGVLVIDGVDMPESVAQALYRHLQGRFAEDGLCAVRREP